jgi:hypothetical protein
MKSTFSKLPAFAFLLDIIMVSASGQPHELVDGGKIEYSIVIEFNKEAIANDAFLRFKTDYDENAINVKFSQGEFKGGELKIKAKDYDILDKNKKEGITLSITPARKIKGGTYSFDLKLVESSPGIELGDNMDLHLDNIILVPEPPVPIWKKIAVIGSILLVLFLIAYIAINYKRKFPKGIIQIIEGETNVEIKLKGKKQFVLSKEIQGFPGELVLVKKLFGYYQGPIIKKIGKEDEVNKSNGEALGIGSRIYSEDTLTIKSNERTITIYYNH